jgi:hypothetical protein
MARLTASSGAGPVAADRTRRIAFGSDCCRLRHIDLRHIVSLHHRLHIADDTDDRHRRFARPDAGTNLTADGTRARPVLAAISSLMIATGVASAISDDEKVRPSRKGMPSTEKYSGLMI